MVDKFSPGDLVVLKSHRTNKMTVEKRNEDGTYLCVWQDSKHKKQSDDYAEILLEKVENPEHLLKGFFDGLSGKVK